MAIQDEYIKTALRLPRDLHADIQASAEKAARSMNAEIVARLQASFETSKKDTPIITVELDSTGYPISWSEIITLLTAIREAGDLNIVDMRTQVYTPELISSRLREVEADELFKKLMLITEKQVGTTSSD